ncbi:MAG: hypothetical protein Terrestrivirus4_73 [Terrestrivirus sp.]|uniref:Uncharacterized protein n=1 Tax=Terrestrivirus sp. TaxID=2487775 RepID=A0A3G4ZME3_9VIRU|nr:MAG: hypothetical protein Terrestrivirus4_73 [Terrestrivirus sp.]
MSVEKKTREYNITVSYDISKLDENTRKSLDKKLDTVNTSFNTSSLTWQGFNTCDNPIDLIVKNPKKHLEIDKLLRKTYGIYPSVYKTSNCVSYPVQRQFLVHILDINYIMNMTITTPEINFGSKEVNSIFSKLQSDTLKIISELDMVNTYEAEYSPTVERVDNIKFVSHCVDTFEMIKEYVKINHKMSEKTMNKLKEIKNDTIHISVDANTSVRFLQKC